MLQQTAPRRTQNKSHVSPPGFLDDLPPPIHLPHSPALATSGPLHELLRSLDHFAWISVRLRMSPSQRPSLTAVLTPRLSASHVTQLYPYRLLSTNVHLPLLNCKFLESRTLSIFVIFSPMPKIIVDSINIFFN